VAYVCFFGGWFAAQMEVVFRARKAMLLAQFEPERKIVRINCGARPFLKYACCKPAEQ